MTIPAETNWRAPLFTQALLVHSAWSTFRLVIVFRALESGADAAYLGYLTAAMAAVAFLVALPAGRWSDRIAPARLALVGIAAATLFSVGGVFATGLWLLLIVAAGLGLTHMLIMVGQQSVVARRTIPGKRDADFAALTLAASFGQLVGPLLFAATELLPTPDEGSRLAAAFGAVAVLVALSLVPAVLLSRIRGLPHAPLPLKGDEPAGSGGWRGLWRPLLVSAIVLGSLDLTYIFVPLWAVERGIGASFVAVLFTVRAVVSILSRLGLSRLVVMVGRKALLATALSAGAVSLAFLPFADAGGSFVVAVGLGIAFGMPQPLTMSWTVSMSRPGHQGAALGLRLAGNRASQVATPLIAGSLTATAGGTPALLLQASLLLAATIVTAFTPRGR